MTQTTIVHENTSVKQFNPNDVTLEIKDFRILQPIFYFFGSPLTKPLNSYCEIISVLVTDVWIIENTGASGSLAFFKEIRGDATVRMKVEVPAFCCCSC